jgi:dolichol-phosphate mannosyltransferase
MSKAIVIIPTYNEAENLPITLEKLADVFTQIQSWQMLVLVVDDNSPDGTAHVVKKLQKKYPFLKLIVNNKKAGLGSAYLKGMDRAFNQLKADLVFEFDADLSHDPQKIPAMLTKIDNGSDLVLGSRYIKGGSIPHNWGPHRKFLSVFGNFFIRLVMWDFAIHDWTTGFRAIKKEVYRAVANELESERFFGYTFQIGFLHKTRKKKFIISEVPFAFKDREIGKSKIGPEYIKNTLLYIMKVRIQEIFQSRIFKFASVGVIGALVQLSSLELYRFLLADFQYFFITSYLIATILSIETAIISNFILSNLWTFADRKLKKQSIPKKFIEFNLTSGGSLLIQMLIAALGENLIGLFTLFTMPVISIKIDTGMVFAVTGILVGMFWNFFAYNTFIWKKKK